MQLEDDQGNQGTQEIKGKDHECLDRQVIRYCRYPAIARTIWNLIAFLK